LRFRVFVFHWIQTETCDILSVAMDLHDILSVAKMDHWLSVVSLVEDIERWGRQPLQLFCRCNRSTEPESALRSMNTLNYASMEDAARGYDYVAVQAHGPDTKCNFPGGAINELPVPFGEERKQRSSSRYVGVSWQKATRHVA
jgi:hypothetical protein